MSKPPALPLLILDRDGVINEDSPDFIRSIEQWRPLPGALEAIAKLHQNGVAVAVASNQSGVGRGLFSAADLEAIHRHMRERIRAAGGELAGIFHCPHLPDAGCDCRKPRPGLLHQLERTLGLSVRGAPMIGDNARDLEAARAAGCRPILVRTGNGINTSAQLRDDPQWRQLEVYDNLAAAADALLSA